MIFALKQRLAKHHFGEDACNTPDVNLFIVSLPGEHDLRRSVESRGNVAGHLGLLDTSQAEVADL